MPSAHEIVANLKTLQEKLQVLLPVLKLEQKQLLAKELEKLMEHPDFWNDAEKAQKITKQHSQIATHHDFWQSLIKETDELLDLSQQNQDESPETLDFLHNKSRELETRFAKKRMETLMTGSHDESDAIFAIHAGAGGTDAQDFAEILFRMYSRFFEKKGFVFDVLEISRGGEAGIKSVLVEVKGLYAYGILKAEAGVHRLVRLSPFNPAHTRETSFALIEVLPVVEESAVTLNEKDLKIETTTSGGHGGQSVNTTYSAVRITHIPTGLKVSIQNERSQHQNKETALKILKSRLQELEDKKQAEEKKELRGEFKSAEWGNQIRSYVLHPYQMVKDHRTGLETSDTEGVLDGEIDEFIEKYLEKINA